MAGSILSRFNINQDILLSNNPVLSSIGAFSDDGNDPLPIGETIVNYHHDDKDLERINS